MTALALVLTLGSIGLRGSTGCPSVQQVQEKLDGLLPPDDGPLYWVELTEQPGRLQLALWAPDGTLEAVRDLPRPARCEALARAAAVAVATWASQAAQRSHDAIEVPDVDDGRVFDPYVLRAARLNATPLIVEAPEERPRLIGPLIIIVVASVLQMTGVALAVTRPGDFHFFESFAVGLSVVGHGLSLGSLVWLLQKLGTGPS